MRLREVGRGTGFCLGSRVVSMLTVGPSGLGLCGGAGGGRRVPHSLLPGSLWRGRQQWGRGLQPVRQVLPLQTGKFNHSLTCEGRGCSVAVGVCELYPLALPRRLVTVPSPLPPEYQTPLEPFI